MPLSVQISPASAGDPGNEFTVRVPEHELPASVRWYEMEFATYVERGGGAAQLARLPVVATDPIMSYEGMQRWATYHLMLPEAHASLLPKPESATHCGAAWKATDDGHGGRVLVIVGEAPHKREGRSSK